MRSRPGTPFLVVARSAIAVIGMVAGYRQIAVAEIHWARVTSNLASRRRFADYSEGANPRNLENHDETAGKHLLSRFCPDFAGSEFIQVS
jgi:hypothetical protein